jgi:hypothetical protein
MPVGDAACAAGFEYIGAAANLLSRESLNGVEKGFHAFFNVACEKRGFRYALTNANPAGPKSSANGA